jgi:ATP-dependent Clp protease ATP-binding subunit ClpA
MPIFSSDLETTLRRSLALARERRHEYATLEHLLLALTDDIDASPALIACGCNVPSLQSTVRTYLDSELENLVDEKVEEPKASNAFQRVVQRAAFQVQSAGNDEVTGVNVLAAIFAERDTHATFFLQEQNVTRYDVVNYISQGAIKFDRKLARVKYRIDEAAKSAPQFVRKKGRLSYVERSSVGSLKERKLAVAERLNQLRSICTARSNEQPQLNSLTNRYAEALGRLRVNNGSYNLFLIGLEIESLVRLKNQSITDRDRNIPLDAD